MVELAVVGGGYWGIACTYLAQQNGVAAVLYDDAQPAGATRNSAGICQHWWYKQEVASRRIPPDWDWTGPSLRWLEELGLVRSTGEQFTSKAKPERRFRPDCYTVEPWRVEALVPPRIHRVVQLVRSEWSWTVCTPGASVKAENVIVTAGAWTDQLLTASGLPGTGVVPLRGRALIVSADVTEVATHLPRPYTHYTLRPWLPGQARIGDTVERSQDGTSSYLQQLMTAATGLLGLQPNVLSVADGVRPVCERYVCDLWSEGLVVATGGHRVGLGLAEPVARRALRLLKLA